MKMIVSKIIPSVVAVLTLLSIPHISQAQSISMSYVTVGNPNNAADPATGSLYGSVSYAYNIGEYDVTDSQYCTFLNAVDPTGANTLGLYDSSATDAEYGVILNSAASNGSKYSVISGYASMPVVDVDYWDTLRFANWMNNGEGNASTETGAYTLLGGTPTPTNSSSLLANPQHNSGATVWLPSENEWYKAAYFNPTNGTYSTYATQSNTAPGNIIGNGSNEANYVSPINGSFSVTQSPIINPNQNYLTAVGSFTSSASYYGTYDQSGDVYNWEATTVSSQYPVLRGAYWNNDNTYAMSSSGRYNSVATVPSEYFGFRVASAAVPEPSTWVMIAAGVGTLGAFRRRRRL